MWSSNVLSLSSIIPISDWFSDEPPYTWYSQWLSSTEDTFNLFVGECVTVMCSISTRLIFTTKFSPKFTGWSWALCIGRFRFKRRRNQEASWRFFWQLVLQSFSCFRQSFPLVANLRKSTQYVMHAFYYFHGHVSIPTCRLFVHEASTTNRLARSGWGIIASNTWSTRSCLPRHLPRILSLQRSWTVCGDLQRQPSFLSPIGGRVRWFGPHGVPECITPRI